VPSARVVASTRIVELHALPVEGGAVLHIRVKQNVLYVKGLAIGEMEISLAVSAAVEGLC